MSWKRKLKRKTITVEESKFFIGEMMTCGGCGKVEKSDPHVESNWTVVELDGKPIYFCPVCFGNARYL